MDPDSELSRREFLERSAYLAGAAGAAATIPASSLLAEAAKAQVSPLPSPRNLPIDHFVILMMENRSFDHYFGWLSDVADGDQDQSFPTPDGVQVPTRHASSMDAQWQGCGFSDPGHGWGSGRAQLNDGFMGAGSGNDEFALTYYNEGELGFIHAAAKAYTTYDRYFCSMLGPTWPNRYYKWSAQSGGRKDNSPPIDQGLGNQWETIHDRALRHNPLNLPGEGALTARYYNSDLPFAAVWGVRGVTWTRPVAQYYLDCALGTLPNIAIVDPPFLDGGGGDGLSADEHPHGDVRLGQAFMSDIVHAFIESPNYRRGALFIVYDEWGGFFDHVRPPRVPDDRASADQNEDFSQMGFRTPAVAISPYARNTTGVRARVNHTTLGHESILKLITYRFGLGDLVTRDAMAANIGETFNWDSPDFDPPGLPDPGLVVTLPCALGGGRDGIGDEADTSTHDQDLENLEHLARRNGYEIGDGSIDSIFRQPDTIKKGVEEGKKDPQPPPPAPVEVSTKRKRKPKRRRKRRKGRDQRAR